MCRPMRWRFFSMSRAWPASSSAMRISTSCVMEYMFIIGPAALHAIMYRRYEALSRGPNGLPLSAVTRKKCCLSPARTRAISFHSAVPKFSGQWSGPVPRRDRRTDQAGGISRTRGIGARERCRFHCPEPRKWRVRPSPGRLSGCIRHAWNPRYFNALSTRFENTWFI